MMQEDFLKNFIKSNNHQPKILIETMSKDDAALKKAASEQCHLRKT